MKYSHERLEKLIKYISDKPESSFQQFFIPDYESFQKAFKEEVGNIETYLIRQSMSIQNELTFKMLVHQYQAIIVSCLDKISAKQNVENIRFPEQVYLMAIDRLQNLFSFIRNRFENYFNCDEKMPDVLLQSKRQEIKGQFNKLEKHLSKQLTNRELEKLVLCPLKKFIISEKKITYRKLFYIQKYEELLFLFSKEKYSGTEYEDKAIIEFMVLINYNSSEMVNHIINKISGTINVLDGQQQKFQKLGFFLKEFNQFKEKAGIGYNLRAGSVREQIIKWLNEEIIYQEKNISLFTKVQSEESEKVVFEDKLHLSVSVEVLTLIARAAKDSKLLVNKHNTELYKNISKYFRTAQAENLSVNSMIKKSYVAERSSKEAAVDVLHAMIKRIHEY